MIDKIRLNHILLTKTVKGNKLAVSRTKIFANDHLLSSLER